MGDRLGKVGNLVEQRLAGDGGAAEHGVDQAADAGFSGFDGFIDGGVVGEIEDEQLAQPDAQDVAGFRIHLTIAEFTDPVVEQAAVAQHSEENRLE